MKPLLQTVMDKEDLDKEQALEMIRYAAQDVNEGADPEEVLSDHFGLEPDWVLDLLEYCI